MLLPLDQKVLQNHDLFEKNFFIGLSIDQISLKHFLFICFSFVDLGPGFYYSKSKFLSEVASLRCKIILKC